MTKPTNSPELRFSGPTGQELEEIAAGAEILFEQPNMAPGVPVRGLSPREMIAATHEPREDQTQDPLLFMVEVPLNAIGKDGVQLLRKQYTGLDMLPLTTGPKHRLRRDLIMRYNRAELARGVLKEIVVLERDAQGVYTELGRATRSDIFRQDTDYSVVLRERAHYVQRLVESVGLDTEQFHRVESGTTALEELASAIHARERFQRRSRQKAIVARPRWDSEAPPNPETEADYGAMHASRPEVAADVESVVPSQIRLADVITGSDPFSEDELKPTRRPRGRQARPQRAKSSGDGRMSAKRATPSRSEVGQDDEPGSVPLIAGGLSGLADLLNSAPLSRDDDDSRT